VTSGMQPAPAPEVDRRAIDEMLVEADPEYGYRRLSGIFAVVVAIVAVAFSLFQLSVAGVSPLNTLRQRGAHVGFALVLVFLLYPLRRRGYRQRRFGVLDVLFAAVAAFVTGYVVWHHDRLLAQAGQLPVEDLWVGALGIVLVLEAGRRVLGVLPFIAGAMIAYPFLGEAAPGLLAVRRFPIDRVIEHLWFTTEGVFGIPIGVAATFVFLFVVLGTFLEKTGLGQMFVEIAMGLAGWMTGGPAKVSVFSSALLGTVSGSSVANVTADGVFNIPLMKRIGYEPRFAAGVEAATSVGGQIMPPVMGAAAFIMAEFLGVPYLTVVQAAIVPAVLYFTSLFFMIHFEAKRLGLRGLRRDELPDVGATIRRRWYLAVPLAVMIGYLLEGFSPARAAFIAIVLSAGVHLVTCLIERRPGSYLPDLWRMLEQAARNALVVSTACAVVGIIIGIVTLTGVGNAFVTMTITLGQQNLFVTLVLVMIACTIIGSGIPTTATYIILAALAVPAVEALLPANDQLQIAPGVTIGKLAAHMFIFYYGVIADLTPPDALAAYAAAGIARTPPLATSVTATRLALAAIVVPYTFVYSPEIMLLTGTLTDQIFAVATAVVGIVLLAAGASGYLLTTATPIERVLLLGAAASLVFHSAVSDAAGVLCAGIVIAAQLARRRRR